MGYLFFKSLSIEIEKTSLKLFEISIICKIQSLKRFNSSDWSCLDILLSWHGLWTHLNYIYIFWKILNYEKLIHCPIHLVSMLLCMMIYTNRRFRIIILPSFTLYWQYYTYNISCKSVFLGTEIPCRRYFSIIRRLYLFFPCFLRFSRVFSSPDLLLDPRLPFPEFLHPRLTVPQFLHPRLPFRQFLHPHLLLPACCPAHRPPPAHNMFPSEYIVQV